MSPSFQPWSTHFSILSHLRHLHARKFEFSPMPSTSIRYKGGNHIWLINVRSNRKWRYSLLLFLRTNKYGYYDSVPIIKYSNQLFSALSFFVRINLVISLSYEWSVIRTKNFNWRIRCECFNLSSSAFIDACNLVPNGIITSGSVNSSCFNLSYSSLSTKFSMSKLSSVSISAFGTNVVAETKQSICCAFVRLNKNGDIVTYDNSHNVIGNPSFFLFLFCFFCFLSLQELVRWRSDANS